MTINIWGRSFDLKVLYEITDEKDVESSAQKLAWSNFAEKSSFLLKSPEKVEQYILEHEGDQVQGEIHNIFHYVMPKYFFVENTSSKRVVDLMCNYRFDPEHGIALSFVDETLDRICPQDEVG